MRYTTSMEHEELHHEGGTQRNETASAAPIRVRVDCRSLHRKASLRGSGWRSAPPASVRSPARTARRRARAPRTASPPLDRAAHRGHSRPPRPVGDRGRAVRPAPGSRHRSATTTDSTCLWRRSRLVPKPARAPGRPGPDRRTPPDSRPTPRCIRAAYSEWELGWMRGFRLRCRAGCWAIATGRRRTTRAPIAYRPRPSGPLNDRRNDATLRPCSALHRFETGTTGIPRIPPDDGHVVHGLRGR